MAWNPARQYNTSMSGIFPVAHCSLDCNEPICKIQWSSTDQYLLFIPLGGNPWYLNAETFQEEVLEHPSDHFWQPNHLYCNRKKLKIQLNGREGPLFLALPLNHDVMDCSLQGDQAWILSWNRQFLLLNILGLEAYLDICNFSPLRVRCVCRAVGQSD